MQTAAASKLNWVSADEALQCVRSGQHIFIGSGCAEPEALVEALIRKAPDLFDVEVLHLLTAGTAQYSESKFEGKFRHNAFFIGANVRSAVNRGRADYTPCFLSEIPKFIRSGKINVDVALVQTSPPDENGNLSLGISVDIVKSAVESARTVIAQVNPRMPRTRGGSAIPAAAFSRLVWAEAPMLELKAANLSAEARKIGRHAAGLVEDGATLQMGIGAIPDAVLLSLIWKKDLGIHTEMFSDGVLKLLEKGVITNRLKSLHPGIVISSFCMGSRRLYEFINDNPLFEFYPSDYVNDPRVIAQNVKMTSINSALQVDLTGQVCADSIGPRFYSGVGGQVDFIRGAAHSEGGKSIIALPSTAKEGAISRIVPVLEPGSGVVTTRADVDFVVTEYGVAGLKGRTIRERTLALIDIAHPKFRPWLLDEAKKLSYVYPDQIPLLSPANPWPGRFETRFKMRGGERVQIRPIKTADERALRDLFYSHSPETIYLRYGIPLKHLSRRQIQDFVTLDYEQTMAIAAFLPEGASAKMLGVARYYLDPSTRMAEMALTVHDRYQGKGLGRFLFKHLERMARAKGVRGFTAQILMRNSRMLSLFGSMSRRIKSRVEDGICHMSYRFDKK
ncbi:MAG: GNAT family N-acetyltransferase [Elusimicrobia bacterium]|nr:GNAT family N-acetyltransferase [Elusimicrobiota bacterium]